MEKIKQLLKNGGKKFSLAIGWFVSLVFVSVFVFLVYMTKDGVLEQNKRG